MIRINFLTIFIFICSIQLSLSKTDKTDSNKVFIMDGVVVTASRIPSLYSSTSRIMNIVSKKDIFNSPANSINRLMKNIPDIDLRQRGPFDVQSDVGIRGGTYDQTLILVNGIKVNDSQTGHHNLDLPVSLNDIERIEVVKGACSRVLGQDAFDGAINIITKEGEARELMLDIGGGQYGSYNLAGTLSYNFDKFSNYLSISKSGSGGYITDTDFQNWNIFYKGGISTDIGEFSADAGYTGKDFGANSFYTPAFPNQFESTRTLFGSAKYTTGDKVKFTVSVYDRQHKDKFELFRDNPADWYSGHNYHLTNIIGGSTDISFEWSGGKTSIGTELRNENIHSNILGNSTGDSIPVPGEHGAYYTKYGSRDNISLFLEHNLSFKDLFFSGGFMMDWITDYKMKIYGGLDIGIKLNDKIHLIGSINQSFRVPTFTDLYYNGPSNTGNPNLKPEEALTLETGLKYVGDNISTYISVFNRNGKDIIDWVRTADTLLWLSMNLTSVSSIGTEFSFNYYPTEEIFKIFQINSVNISYTYIWMNKQSGNYFSNYVLDYLKHKMTLNIQHSIIDKLGMNWNITVEDREGTYYDVNANREKEYNPFLLLDARLFYNFNSFNFYIEGTNLLNTFYRDHSYVPTPGRWLLCGFKYNLNLENR